MVTIDSGMRSPYDVAQVALQLLMKRFQWGRAVFAIGGNETAALFTGLPVARLKTSVFVVAGLLASVSGIVLAVAQGQGKADLATATSSRSSRRPSSAARVWRADEGRSSARSSAR